jgi:hypothetical protein
MTTTPITPSPPHEALAFFDGTWTTEESPPEEGFVETCAWLNGGRRHMVCRSTWQTESGPRAGMSIFSYREADSTYLYHGFRSNGGVELLQGHPIGDGWQFTHKEETGGIRQRTQVTITRISNDHFKLVAESAEGDSPWVVDGIVNYKRIPNDFQK